MGIQLPFVQGSHPGIELATVCGVGSLRTQTVGRQRHRLACHLLQVRALRVGSGVRCSRPQGSQIHYTPSPSALPPLLRGRRRCRHRHRHCHRVQKSHSAWISRGSVGMRNHCHCQTRGSPLQWSYPQPLLSRHPPCVSSSSCRHAV